MSYVVLPVHAVWTTKNRENRLSNTARFKIFNHIREKCKENQIRLHFINGVENHVHCLLYLDASQTLAYVMNQIKGESSNWINKTNLIQDFKWQKEYYATSVSPKAVPIVRQYIRNQREHHKDHSLIEETKSIFGITKILD